MKIDTMLLPGMPLKDSVRAARHAEDLGFDAIWTAETGHNPFFPLVLAAEHTKKIKLGTAIAVAFPRSPMVTASIAWDLQELSSGRFILGLGTQVKGHNERRFSVKWEPPGPKLKEQIESLHAIWDCWQNGTPLNYHGKFYHFDLMTPFFAASPIEHPKIPIYIAAVNPYMFGIAGQVCDGIHVHGFHTLDYLKQVAIPALEEGAKKAGRAPKEIALSSAVFVVMGKNSDEIEAMKAPIKQQISFYGSTRTYKGVLDLHGWGETCTRLHELSKKGEWGAMPDLITDEMLDKFAVIGRTDDIVDKIKERYEGILDRVSFYAPPTAADEGKWQEIIRSFNG